MDFGCVEAPYWANVGPLSQPLLLKTHLWATA